MTTVATIAWIVLIFCRPVVVAALKVSVIGKLEVIEGDDAVLKCNVTHSNGTVITPCSGDVGREWLVDGSTIASCSARGLGNYSRELKFDPETGSLTIYNIRVTDAAMFYCAVYYLTGGYECNSTELIVQRGVAAKLEVIEGDDAVLKCNVTRSDGKVLPPCSNDVKIEWIVDGLIIASCSAKRLGNYSRVVKFDSETGSLTIYNVRVTDAAVFGCAVEDRFFGYKYSSTELIVREKFRVQTSVLHTPYIGSNVSLQCSVLADSPLHDRWFQFQWLRGNDSLSDNKCKGIEGSSEKDKYGYHHDSLSCNLTVLNVDTNDNGMYTCKVNDSFYEQSNSTELEVTEIVTATNPSAVSVSVHTPTAISTWSTASWGKAKGTTEATEPVTSEKTSTSPVLLLVAVILLVLLSSAISLLVCVYWIHGKGGQANSNQYFVHFRRNSQLTPEQQALTVPERSEIVTDSRNDYEENHAMAPTAPSSTKTHLMVKVQHTTRDGVEFASVSQQEKERTWYHPANDNNRARAHPKRIARSQEELVYIDIQHLRQHPRYAPPIRTEPPTEYAEIRHVLASGSTLTGPNGWGAEGGKALP